MNIKSALPSIIVADPTSGRNFLVVFWPDKWTPHPVGVGVLKIEGEDGVADLPAGVAGTLLHMAAADPTQPFEAVADERVRELSLGRAALHAKPVDWDEFPLEPGQTEPQKPRGGARREPKSKLDDEHPTELLLGRPPTMSKAEPDLGPDAAPDDRGPEAPNHAPTDWAEFPLHPDEPKSDQPRHADVPAKPSHADARDPEKPRNGHPRDAAAKAER